MTDDHFKEDKECDWTRRKPTAEAKRFLSISHASDYSACDLLDSKRSPCAFSSAGRAYSIPANSSFNSAVSCFRTAGVPISLPLMWLTGAIKRMLEISQTASASNRSCGTRGP